MSIIVWAQVAVFTHDIDVWDRLCTVGRAPCTRETLPDFRESGRVTRHSQVFRRLMGSQRIPGIWGVTKISGLIPFAYFLPQCIYP